MEASSLRHASRSGLLGRRSPLLRLQSDDRLVALIRAGHDRAFEVLFDRYHARLLAFCRHMLRSSEDAEDVLQEVFANAHAAMLGDEREIKVRPWLYRIARNRCLNHLRKPVPEGQESMDVHPHDGGTTTAERVQTREDFRALVADVQELAETQRTALLLREIDALSYEEIAAAMDTTVPAVKSLLVRARMSLAEASQSRHLTCGDVQLELAEAAEGLRKVSGPVRHHVRGCEDCHQYRSELRTTTRALGAIAPAGLLVLLHKLLGTKLIGLGASSAATSSAAAGATGATAGATGAAAGATGAAASAAGAAATGGGAALSGAAVAASGGLGTAIAAKAAAGIATAALITAGAVEVRHLAAGGPDAPAPGAEASESVTSPGAPPAPAVTVAAEDDADDDGADEDERARKDRDGDGEDGRRGEDGDPTESGADSEPATTESSDESSASTSASDRDSAAGDSAGNGAVGGGARGGGHRNGPPIGSGNLPPDPADPGDGEPPVDPTDPIDPADPGDDDVPEPGGPDPPFEEPPAEGGPPPWAPPLAP